MSDSAEEIIEKRSLSKYSIIAVDDEDHILQSLKRIFRHEDYRFLCATSGDEALVLLAQTPLVAVIISDQRMPKMSGSEFLSRSKELAPDAIKMLLTGHSDIQDTITAINEGGATHYLLKPWDNTALLQTVRDGVQQYRLVLENREQLEIINRQNEKLRELLSQLTEQNEELERLASSDGLTGLTNRRRLFEYLGNELHRIHRYGGALSLIMFDIDHFKKVNDTWGHGAGDTVLREIAHQTRLMLREVDISARYGGEEFVILLPETELDGAVMIANRLRERIEATVVMHEANVELSVTISLGVALLGADESGEELLTRADQAMYRAKNSGRNRVEIAEKKLSAETH